MNTFKRALQSLSQQEKEELKKDLNRGNEEKLQSCVRKNGTFDYLKMSELYHSGKW